MSRCYCCLADLEEGERTYIRVDGGMLLWADVESNTFGAVCICVECRGEIEEALEAQGYAVTWGKVTQEG